MTEKIISIVKRILNDCDITNAPIPVVKIAEKYGFVVVEKYLDEESGYMVLSKNGVEVNGVKKNKIIVINTTETPYRKRFTIAHELGHYFLEYKDIEHNLTNDVVVHREHHTANLNNLDKERDADMFAGELLVPTEMLQVILSKMLNVELLLADIPDIVSRKFGISYSAAKVRYDKFARSRYAPR